MGGNSPVIQLYSPVGVDKLGGGKARRRESEKAKKRESEKAKKRESEKAKRRISERALQLSTFNFQLVTFNS
jgi:hypothetical protein